MRLILWFKTNVDNVLQFITNLTEFPADAVAIYKYSLRRFDLSNCFFPCLFNKKVIIQIWK